jgi:hypothetical protein
MARLVLHECLAPTVTYSLARISIYETNMKIVGSFIHEFLVVKTGPENAQPTRDA